jgi:hypothetical protein
MSPPALGLLFNLFERVFFNIWPINELHVRHWRSVAGSESCFENPKISAGALLIPRTQIGK